MGGNQLRLCDREKKQVEEEKIEMKEEEEEVREVHTHRHTSRKEN